MRPAYPHPLVAREGWLFLAVAVLVSIAAGFALGWGWSIPFWLVALFILQFFRDPAREVPDDPAAVVSPADGRIVEVSRARDPWLERDAQKVSVFMNVFNVHSNRAPVDGVVKERWYFPGAFLNAALDKASEDNERETMVFRSDTGLQIGVVRIAGLIARRIVTFVREGQTVEAGSRIGLIRFGSRVDVYIPGARGILVAEGQRVVGGETVLADLRSQENAREVRLN